MSKRTLSKLVDFGAKKDNRCANRTVLHLSTRLKGIRMAGKISIFCYCLLICLLAGLSRADQLSIADFSKSSLEGWEKKVFAGTTSYRLFDLKGKRILAAESQNCASGLIKKVHVDIKKYPYLNWSWRLENRLNIENEKLKSGDDYAARIYVVVDGGILKWRSKALSYVWANGAKKGDIWQNAFVGQNAVMMALRSRKDSLLTWYSERRNVYEDLKGLFGKEFHFIDAIALMTDSDNSHGTVKAYYGDIYFTEE